MADPSKRPHRKQSPYTVDRGIPGAYEGETVTRRRLFTGGALAAGGIASAAFGLPALGFALGPLFERSEAPNFQDVGPESDFNPETYVAKVVTIDPYVGEPGKTTVYVASTSRPDLVTAWEVYREHMGGHDVPSTLLGVAVLGYPDQLVEVEAVAVIG